MKILKQYHKANFNLIFVQGKEDYKIDFKGRKKELSLDRVLEEQIHSRPSFLFFFIILLFFLHMEG